MSSADRWDDFMEGRAKPLHLPPGMTWRAHDAAGLGHLLPQGNDKPGLRYLCGGLPIAARYGWPVRQRCVACVAALTAGGRS